jgi:hypothetical protein
MRCSEIGVTTHRSRAIFEGLQPELSEHTPIRENSVRADTAGESTAIRKGRRARHAADAVTPD